MRKCYGCTIDIVDLGVVQARTITLMIWTGTRTDMPTLGSIPNDQLDYTLTVGATNLQLNIAVPVQGTRFIFR